MPFTLSVNEKWFRGHAIHVDVDSNNSNDCNNNNNNNNRFNKKGQPYG